MATLLERATEIRDETRGGYNTAARVGQMFYDVVNTAALTWVVNVDEDSRTATEGDLVYINELINTISTVGGGNIYVRPGTYTAGTAGQLVLKSDVNLIGEPGAVFDFSTRTNFSTYLEPLVKIKGSYLKDGETVEKLLTTSATIYGNQIKCDSSVFAENDMVFIYRDEAFDPNNPTHTKQGELNIVKKIVDASTIELLNTLRYDYPTTDNAKILLVGDPIHDVTIDNIKFIGKGNNVTGGVWGTQSDECIHSIWAKEISVVNCEFENIQTRNIVFLHTIEFLCQNNTIRFDQEYTATKIQYGIYYGNSTCHGNVISNYIYNGKHAIVDGYLFSYIGGVTQNINVVQNHCIGQWAASISEHEGGSENITYSKNIIDGSVYGFDIRSSKSKIINNVISVLSSTGGYGLWLKHMVADITIAYNSFNNSDRGIVAETGFGDFSNDNIKIKNNTFLNCTSGINVTRNLNNLPAIGWQIFGNTFKNISSRGILLKGKISCDVFNNIFQNVTSGGTTRCIELQGAVNSEIAKNKFFNCKVPIFLADTTTSETPPVALVCDAIEITGNRWVDTTGSITNNATGSVVIKDNPSFTTENSGTATIGSSDDPPSSTITHGIALTPTASQIRITPTSALGAATHWWISDVGATTFKININAVAGSPVTFEWRIVI